jgi:nitrogen regulatory protein PII
MRIDRYGFGELVVDGREIRSDVLLTPDGVQEHWWRREGHVLRLEDLRLLLDSHPERLIIGSGAFGRMRPDPGLGPELAARGVAVEVLPTAEDGQVLMVAKLRVDVAVEDRMADLVVDAIAKSVNTGTIGDGKIWVCSLEGALRVRTGERDRDAL